MTPFDITIAVGAPVAALVVWLVMLGRSIGNAESRLKALEGYNLSCDKEQQDLDQRLRVVEQHLPALSTKVDHAADGIAEMKTDMRVGFERLEALMNAFMSKAGK